MMKQAVCILLALMLMPLAVLHAKPNVVVLLSNDLGYQDVGCYNGPVKTQLWMDRPRRVSGLPIFIREPRSALPLGQPC